MSNWFKGLRLKLLVLIGVPMALVLGLATASYVMITSLEDEVAEGAFVTVPRLIESGRLAADMHAVVRYYWTVPGSGRNAAERQHFMELTRAALDDFDDAAKKFEPLLRSEASKSLYHSVPDAWSHVKPAFADGLAALALNTKEGDEKAAQILAERIRPVVNSIGDKIQEINNRLVSEQAQKAEREGMRIHELIAVAVVILAALFIFGILLASRLAKQFTGIAHGISETVSEFGAAANQLMNAGETLSNGSAQAASSLEQTVASIEELSSMVKQNAENSKEAGTISNAAKLSAEEGEGEVRQLVEAMHEISQSSKQIEEIIAVIDDLAFQTNLLALNAAVEAARAGEQGKGFAVVAEAVRGLAQKSGEAAKNIGTLIKESVNRVERGSRTADKSGEVLRAIVTNVKRVADLNQEIAAASAEQSLGLAQISRAMNQLDQATQSNASTAEETATASDQLRGGVDNVRHLVAQLTEAVDGVGGSSIAPAPRFEPRAEPAFAAPSRANVVPFERSKAAPPARAASPRPEELIPFDTDDANPKVGNTNGF